MFPHPALLDVGERLTNILKNINSPLLLAPHFHLFSSGSLPTLLLLFKSVFFPLFFHLMPHFLDFLSHCHAQWQGEVSFHFSRNQASLLTPQVCENASRLGRQVAVGDRDVSFTGASQNQSDWEGNLWLDYQVQPLTKHYDLTRPRTLSAMSSPSLNTSSGGDSSASLDGSF